MNRFVPIRARTRLIFYVIMVFFLNVIMYMGYDVMFSVFCEAPRYGVFMPGRRFVIILSLNIYNYYLN
jgi:hypothetical protein